MTSTRRHFAFALCCHSNANPCTDCKSAQYCTARGTPTIPPSYILVRAVVWACGSGQTARQTNRRAWPIYISRRLRFTRNLMTPYHARSVFCFLQ